MSTSPIPASSLIRVKSKNGAVIVPSISNMTPLNFIGAEITPYFGKNSNAEHPRPACRRTQSAFLNEPDWVFFLDLCNRLPSRPFRHHFRKDQSGSFRRNGGWGIFFPFRRSGVGRHAPCLCRRRKYGGPFCFPFFVDAETPVATL